MKYAFFLASFFSSFAFANITAHVVGMEEVKILHVVEFSKGLGCVQATAMIAPMTPEQCKKFLARYGMHPWVDTRNPMMQIEREAIIPIGKQLYYVQDKDGTKKWAMSPVKDSHKKLRAP
jgi:hypothetical protein